MNVPKAFIVLIIIVFTIISCNTTNNKEQLIVYCGITMIKPISEIAKIIEKQENCTINIIKGGSGIF